MNHFLEDYTDPQLTVIRIGDIQSRSLYTPPYYPFSFSFSPPLFQGDSRGIVVHGNQVTLSSKDFTPGLFEILRVL